jgi:hypothetical protein
LPQVCRYSSFLPDLSSHPAIAKRSEFLLALFLGDSRLPRTLHKARHFELHENESFASDEIPDRRGFYETSKKHPGSLQNEI